jgi:hypothetical protein
MALRASAFWRTRPSTLPSFLLILDLRPPWLGQPDGLAYLLQQAESRATVPLGANNGLPCRASYTRRIRTWPCCRSRR